jgi:hypothetical protein
MKIIAQISLVLLAVIALAIWSLPKIEAAAKSAIGAIVQEEIAKTAKEKEAEFQSIHLQPQMTVAPTINSRRMDVWNRQVSTAPNCMPPRRTQEPAPIGEPTSRQ